FADLVVVRSLEGFEATRVYKDGTLVAAEGTTLQQPLTFRPDDGAVRGTLRLPPLDRASFGLPVPDGRTRARCLVALPNRIVTGSELVAPTVVDGAAVADPERDLAKLACVERHGRGGEVAVC